MLAAYNVHLISASFAVDLFHCGVGNSRDNRYIVVSIHSDGFRYVEDLAPPPPDVPVRRCRPWFCRTDHPDESFVESATTDYKARINALIDQPGQCLRDGADYMDMTEMKGCDLSAIPPPTDLDKNWVLVDSAVKMKECAKELYVSVNEGWAGLDCRCIVCY